MTDNKEKSPQLLPIGLSDLLPPQAAFEDTLLRRLCDYFAACGYERVKPPLLEFENKDSSEKCFRLLDPMSKDSRSMILRADMTRQIDRIASDRLAHAAHPLRLFYSGEVLRIKGSQLRPQRQFLQVGAEIFYEAPNLAAVEEIIILAAQAIEHAIGKRTISFDLSLPSLCGQLRALMLGEVTDAYTRAAIETALNAGDDSYLRTLELRHANLLADLIASSGDYDKAIAALDRVAWPSAAEQKLYERLKNLGKSLQAKKSSLRLIVDIADSTGLDYHSGVAFTIYAEGFSEVLGRGGEYRSQRGEYGCGFSLYMDSVLRIAGSHGEAARRVLAAQDSALSDLENYRSQGYIVVLDWEDSGSLEERACSGGFGYVLLGGELRALAEV